MKAMILAAGLGTRLRPLTNTVPKVMLPVGSKPLLEYHLDLLKKYGIREIAINLHYLPDAIKNHLGDGSKFGVNITYLFEPELLGTASAVKELGWFFDETFLVIYGDNLVEVDFSKLIKFHELRGGLATIAVYHHPEPWTPLRQSPKRC